MTRLINTCRRPSNIASYLLLAVYLSSNAQCITEARAFVEHANIRRQILSFPSRVTLNRYLLHGYANIPVTVAAKEGRIDAVVAQLLQLGGRVDYKATDVDYLRGMIPTREVRTLETDDDVIDIDLGNRANIDGVTTFVDAAEAPAADTHVRDYPLPIRPAIKSESISLSALTPVNSVLPTSLIGAPQFVLEHPTYDGRGVTIAVLEGVGDLCHPMLRDARLLDGSISAKVTDILDPRTDPELRKGDGATVKKTWFADLSDVETDEKGGFTIGEQRYWAPSPGRYLFATFPRSGIDLNVTGLWNRERDLVWIDTNADHDFRDERGIRDFAEHQDVVEVRPSRNGLDGRCVAVRTDRMGSTLRLYAGGLHTTAVASVAAGTNILGSKANGAAPGSRIIYVVPSEDSPVEAFLVAARDPRVDLITCSGCGEDGQWIDGVQNLILERIIERYKKPVFVAIGDGGQFAASTGDFAGVPRTFAIGTYSDHATEETHRASPFFNDEDEYVNGISDSGPSGLGALKPDFLAPSLTAYAIPCASSARKESSHVFGLCTGIGNGMSSFATPMAAGGAALLISAAKQAGILFDVDRIRWALMASAHHLQNWPIDRQGGGLLQVGPAWEELKKLANRGPIEIRSFARINTTDVSSNRTPGSGVSIFDWEGWHPGDARDRTLYLYRNNGPLQSLTYRLDWIGNDGTFSAQRELIIPLQKQTPLQIHVTTRSSNLHSAILRLTDATTNEYAGQFGIYVVAADPLDAAHKFHVTSTGRISRNRSAGIFVDILPHTALVELSLHLHSGAVRFFAWRPEWWANKTFLYPSASTDLIPEEGPYPNTTPESTLIIPNPTPGVWEFLIDDGEGLLGDRYLGSLKPGELKESRFSLDASATMVDNSPATMGIPHEWASKKSLGTLYEDSIMAAAGETAFYKFDVPPKTEELTVRLSRAIEGDNDALPDLYVYRCISNDCHLWTHKSGADQRLVHVKFPSPGSWVIAAQTIHPNLRERITLHILELQQDTDESRPAPSKSSTPQFPEFVRVIDHCLFRSVIATEYWNSEAEFRELLSPLNDIQYHWKQFRPAPLVQRVERNGNHGCTR